MIGKVHVVALLRYLYYRVVSWYRFPYDEAKCVVNFIIVEFVSFLEPLKKDYRAFSLLITLNLEYRSRINVHITRDPPLTLLAPKSYQPTTLHTLIIFSFGY